MLKIKVKLLKFNRGAPGAVCCRFVTVLVLLCSMAGWPVPAEAAKIQYKFNAWNGPELRVFVTRPVGLAPDRPVVFVIHDDDELNMKAYREQWHELAIEHDFLLVAPEISHAESPGSRKNHLGRLFDEAGGLRADAILSYFAIEALFDEVRSHFDMSTDTYSLYGHSMGAQYVQRFIYYVPTARVRRVVAADAAWYMMADFDVDFPYGLGRSAIDPSRLEKSLQVPFRILLGAEDDEVHGSQAHQAPEVMAQGPDRMARGRTFIELARGAADERGVPFNWSVETVEGAGSVNDLMAPAAIPFLLSK